MIMTCQDNFDRTGLDPHDTVDNVPGTEHARITADTVVRGNSRATTLTRPPVSPRYTAGHLVTFSTAALPLLWAGDFDSGAMLFLHVAGPIGRLSG